MTNAPRLASNDKGENVKLTRSSSLVLLSALAMTPSAAGQQAEESPLSNPHCTADSAVPEPVPAPKTGPRVRVVTGHSDWLAQAGAHITFVDFDELPDGQKINGTGALLPWGIADTTGTSSNGDQPGIVDQYVTASTSLSFPMFVPGTLPSEPNFLSNDPTFPGGPAATGEMSILFVEPRMAVGFFVADQTPLDGFRAQAYLGTDSVETEEFPPRTLPNSFVGLVSDLPFDRVVIRAKHSQDSWGLDGLEHAGSAPGTSYCSANLNSTGFAAHIVAAGSPSIAINDLTLAALPVPDQFGIFYFGQTQTFTSFGNGFMCVTGGLTRILPPTAATGNIAVRSIDLAALDIVPGTLHFQFWMRDPLGGGALFNTSSGYSIEFVP